jgi:hypothetical protein
MEFKIEKGIPPPIGKKNGKYPYDKMDVGDSFYIEGAKITTISASIYHQNKKNKNKFASKTVDSGVRVWRIQ